MNEELIKAFLDKRNVFAVVGLVVTLENMDIKFTEILKMPVTKCML